MSELGQKPKSLKEHNFSALPPISDIARHRRRYPHGVAGRGWKYADREAVRFWCAAVGARARTNRDGRLSR
jgi:hypothetical protein